MLEGMVLKAKILNKKREEDVFQWFMIAFKIIYKF